MEYRQSLEIGNTVPLTYCRKLWKVKRKSAEAGKENG